MRAEHFAFKPDEPRANLFVGSECDILAYIIKHFSHLSETVLDFLEYKGDLYELQVLDQCV